MSRSNVLLSFASAFGLSLALSLSLSACGGSEDANLVADGDGVRLEGCVVDRFYVPDEGVPVRVVSADGRLLASTHSGRRGEFVVQLPLGVPASMAVDHDGGDTLPVPPLDRDQVVDACLVASR